MINKETIDEISNKILEFKSEVLKDAFLFDYFEDFKNKNFKAGYRFIFQHIFKTLTDEEINFEMENLIKEILRFRMYQFQDTKKMISKKYNKFFLYLILIFAAINSFSDNFENNIYNNHGSVGLINMPSARFFDESTFGITAYDGTPDQKITFTASPFDWLEASFFYTNIQGLPYPGYEYQDYKDKGFNVKVRLKEQGILPALAIGVNDLAGTGPYSGEYVVSSYELNNFDFHAGLGWGTLNGLSDFKNPLIYLDERFKNRPTEFADKGGQFQPSRYFQMKTSQFFLDFHIF